MTARARLALAIIALLTVVGIVYAPVARGTFIGDDHALIGTNRLVQSGSVLEIFRQPFWAPDPVRDARAAYYRPLVVLSLRADVGFAADDAGSFHTTNLGLHLLATLALVLAAKRLGASTPAALIATAVWALHPRSTESVAWISGRAELLAAMAGFVAMTLWPWYAEAPVVATRRARSRAAAAGGAVLLALLAKEVAVAVVLAIAVGTWLGDGGKGRERMTRVAKRLVYLAVPMATYGVLRWMARRSVAWELPSIGSTARGGTILETVGRYGEMTVDPWHPATGIGLAGDVDVLRVVLGAAVLAGCTALLVREVLRQRRAARQDPPVPISRAAVAIAVAAVLGLGSLALVVHIVPIVLAAAIAADRLLYLPLAGLALGLAVASAKLSPRRRKIAAGVAVALAMSFVPVTRARARDYQDELLFRLVAAEHSHPHNMGAKSGLAHTLRAATEVELACRLHASARRTLDRLGRSDQRYIRVLENVAACHATMGDYERAEVAYRELLALRPGTGRLHFETAVLQLQTFRLDDAEASLRRAVTLDPQLEDAQRALVLMPAVRAELALFATEEARREDPVRWARLLVSLGRVPDATKAWLAIVLEPTTSAADAFNGLQYLLVDADTPTLQRAMDGYALRESFDLKFQRALLARRVARQKNVDALRSRIEALAAE